MFKRWRKVWSYLVLIASVVDAINDLVKAINKFFERDDDDDDPEDPEPDKR